jgi:hypothetical protein
MSVLTSVKSLKNMWTGDCPAFVLVAVMASISKLGTCHCMPQ